MRSDSGLSIFNYCLEWDNIVLRVLLSHPRQWCDTHTLTMLYFWTKILRQIFLAVWILEAAVAFCLSCKDAAGARYNIWYGKSPILGNLGQKFCETTTVQCCASLYWTCRKVLFYIVREGLTDWWRFDCVLFAMQFYGGAHLPHIQCSVHYWPVRRLRKRNSFLDGKHSAPYCVVSRRKKLLLRVMVPGNGAIILIQ